MIGTILKAYAVFISAPDQAHIEESRETAKEYLPLFFTLPCGNVFTAETLADIPEVDMPCPCGDTGHWFVE